MDNTCDVCGEFLNPEGCCDNGCELLPADNKTAVRSARSIQCPKCNKRNHWHSTHCNSCKINIDVELERQKNTKKISFEQSNTISPSLLKICHSCCHNFSRRASSCPKCGAVDLADCHVCKKRIAVNSVSCPECGDPEPFQVPTTTGNPNIDTHGKVLTTEPKDLQPSEIIPAWASITNDASMLADELIRDYIDYNNYSYRIANNLLQELRGTLVVNENFIGWVKSVDVHLWGEARIFGTCQEFAKWMHSEIAPRVIAKYNNIPHEKTDYTVSKASVTNSSAAQSNRISSQNTPTTAATHASLKGKPWRRFWARIIDQMIHTIPVALLFGIIAPEFTTETLKKYGQFTSNMAYLPFVLILEMLIISMFGSTLGKYLLGVRLSGNDGGRVSFGSSAIRTISLWVKGLAFGFPVVCLFTAAYAADKIKKTSIASWDKDASISVEYSPLSGGKVFVAILLLGGLFALNAIGQNL